MGRRRATRCCSATRTPATSAKWLRTEQLRPATPDEQALERAQSMGIQTQFATVWEACERWVITLVWWRQQHKPERWLVDTDPHGRGPVVTSLLAAALHAVVRAGGWISQPTAPAFTWHPLRRWPP